MRTLPRVTRRGRPHPRRRGLVRPGGGCPAAARGRTLDDFTLGATSLLGTGRPKVVLAVGAAHPTSGLLELVEAFRRAGLPGWQLRIAGGRTAARGPGHVHRRPRPVRRDSGARPAAGPGPPLPRRGRGRAARTRDAYGLPVLEALSAGVPVIGASTVPAVSRFVHAGVNGVVLNRTDPAAIAEALVAVSDDHRRGELARGARENPSGLLDTAGRARLARFVDAVLDEPRPVPPSPNRHRPYPPGARVDRQPTPHRARSSCTTGASTAPSSGCCPVRRATACSTTCSRRSRPPACPRSSSRGRTSRR